MSGRQLALAPSFFPRSISVAGQLTASLTWLGLLTPGLLRLLRLLGVFPAPLAWESVPETPGPKCPGLYVSGARSDPWEGGAQHTFVRDPGGARGLAS